MHIVTLFIWFILYSIIGWIYETVYCSIKQLSWDNRGMLIGPYCPIYGVGAVLDVLICSSLPDACSVFFTCMLGSAVLEYATSYATERIFHAVWWDYSSQSLNLHGRICLPCSVGFGFAGLLVLYGLHPFISRLTAPIPHELQELAALLAMAVFAADCALTADSLAQINAKLEAALHAIDTQIAERYSSFISNARQNLSEGIDSLREKISLEEYREHRTKEEIKKTLSDLNWVQTRLMSTSISFPRTAYSDIGKRVKHALSFRKKKKKTDSQTKQ